MAYKILKKKINPNLVETWFLSVLKEGFATSNINFFVDFKTIARNQLKKIIHKHGFAMKNDFVDFFFDGFKNLKAHDDILNAFRLLQKKGFKIVTLTNGSKENTEVLLQKNNLSEYVVKCFSIDQVKKWKPNPEPYQMVLEHFKLKPYEAIMIAAHGWDLLGAKNVGLLTGYITRYEFWINDYFSKPDFEDKNAEGLVKKIIAESTSI